MGPLARLRASAPDNAEYAKLEIEGLGYLSDALERGGRLPQSLTIRSRQIARIRQMQGRSPSDTDLQSRLLIALRSAARQLHATGKRDLALEHSARAVVLSDGLLRTEPGNRDWLDRSAGSRLDHAALLLQAGRAAEAAAANEAGCRAASETAGLGRVVRWTRNARLCLENHARISLANGNKGQAMLYAGQLLSQLDSHRTADQVEDRFDLAAAYMLVGEIQRQMNDVVAANRAWSQAAANWPGGVAETPRQLARRRDLLERLGRTDEATALGRRLQATGWRN
jgi:hypothetical protein